MALHRLPAEASVDDIVAALDERGYALLERFMAPEDVAAKRAALDEVLARTPTGRNDFEGFHTQRIYALFAKTRAFDDAAINPTLLAVLERVLGPFQFSAPVAIHIGPDETAQVLHRDEDVYPLPRPHDEVVFNTMWALCDFTEANGATRLVPGSHRWEPGRRPPRRTRRWPPRCRPVPCCSTRAACGTAAAPTRPTARGWASSSSSSLSWLRPQETHLLAVPPEIVVPNCPSDCRSCSATTSTRRSWATSTAGTRGGRCHSPRTGTETVTCVGAAGLEPTTASL